MRQMRKVLTVPIVGLVVAAVPRSADARTCGYAFQAHWNVPKGGLVVSRSRGVIQKVMDAVNEWGSHVMLSHGTGGWVTHSAPRGFKTQNSCSEPIVPSSLREAGPGPSQTSLAGVWNYFFDFKISGWYQKRDTTTAGPGVTWIVRHYGDAVGDGVRQPTSVPTRGNTSTSNTSGFVIDGQVTTRVTDAAGLNPVQDIPMYGESSLLGYEWYSGNSPDADSAYFQGRRTNGVLDEWRTFAGGSNRGAMVADWLWSTMPFRHRSTANVYELLSPDTGAELYYRWNDLMNVGEAARGRLVDNTGTVCSVLQGYASYASGAGGVVPATYPDDVTRAGIDAAWRAAKDACEQRSGWLTDVLGTVACGSGVACDSAANQVTNALTAGTANGGTNWQSFRGDSAVSISPDCVAGYNRCYSTGGGSSPWGWAPPNMIQWSGGGYVYGCWD